MASRDTLEVCCERVYLRRASSASAAIDTELFFGTPVTLLEREGGWSKVWSSLDGYTGYVEDASLALWASLKEKSVTEAIVVVPLALGYGEAKDTAAASAAFPMSSRLHVLAESSEEGGNSQKESFVAVRVRESRSRHAGEGKVFVKRHQILALAECGRSNGRDWVATALKFMDVPYLYGGGCYAGIDCSALLQVSMGVHGIACPRDTAAWGHFWKESLEWVGEEGRNPLPELKRGDLVFWHRHVGVMVDGEEMLHANASSMSVACEPLVRARARIMGVEGEIRFIKRLFY